MRKLAVLVVLVATIACTLAPMPVRAQQPERQEEFLPLDQLPPQDQLPAAPLLIGAYSFVVLMLFLYLVSVARRMATVQKEIERLEGDFKRTGRT